MEDDPLHSAVDPLSSGRRWLVVWGAKLQGTLGDSDWWFGFEP